MPKNYSESSFEEASDVQIFFILKLLSEKYNLNDIDSSSLDDGKLTSDIIQIKNKSGMFNNFEDVLDINYLISLFKLNPNLADSEFPKKYDGRNFIRPTPTVYSYDYDEFRVEYVRRTYKHYITSYSNDIVYETINNSEVDIYDGDEVDADYYDGETTEIRIDKDSIRPIKK